MTKAIDDVGDSRKNAVGRKGSDDVSRFDKRYKYIALHDDSAL